jgi:hypothetical protein
VRTACRSGLPADQRPTAVAPQHHACAQTPAITCKEENY